jgi:hypothetical protein|tara:strand:+ start:174 stop:581 length:408 start_codon:yes stop_codon:yes gene_type:complete
MYGKETKELKINNMARKSSAAPFKMQAAKWGNSPMKKNFPNDMSALPGDSPNKFSWAGAAKGAIGGFLVGGPAGAVVGGAVGGFTLGEKKTVEEKIEEKENQKVEEVVDAKVSQAENAGGMGTSAEPGENELARK